MPLSRRKGPARKIRAGDLDFGDLVIAKVRGFRAWPAKIGDPGKWNRVPDPKKFFVEFFVTGEIAFIAPADIQLLTQESKTTLLARCQRKKTPKHFVPAVEEICKAFEKLQQKSTDEHAVGNIIQVSSAIDTSSADSIKDNHHANTYSYGENNHDQEENHKSRCYQDELQGLEHCTSFTGTISSGPMANVLVGSDSASKEGTAVPLMSISVNTPNEEENDLVISLAAEDACITFENETKEALQGVSNAVHVHRATAEDLVHLDKSDSSILSFPSQSVEAKVMDENGHQSPKVVQETRRNQDCLLTFQRNPMLRKQSKKSVVQEVAKSDGKSTTSQCYDALNPLESFQREDTSIIQEDVECKNLETLKKHSADENASDYGHEIIKPGIIDKSFLPTASGSTEKFESHKKNKRAERFKLEDGTDMQVKCQKGDPSPFSAKNRRDKVLVSGKTKVDVKNEHDHPSRLEKNHDMIDERDEEASRPLLKRHRKVAEAVSTSGTEYGSVCPPTLKNKSPSVRLQSRRRSRLLDEDDVKGDHWTPVHTQSVSTSVSLNLDQPPSFGSCFDAKECIDPPSGVGNSLTQNPSPSRNSNSVSDAILPESCPSPLKVGSKSSCKKTIESRADKSMELSISNSPRKVEHRTSEVSKTAERFKLEDGTDMQVKCQKGDPPPFSAKNRRDIVLVSGMTKVDVKNEHDRPSRMEKIHDMIDERDEESSRPLLKRRRKLAETVFTSGTEHGCAGTSTIKNKSPSVCLQSGRISCLLDEDDVKGDRWTPVHTQSVPTSVSLKLDQPPSFGEPCFDAKECMDPPLDVGNFLTQNLSPSRNNNSVSDAILPESCPSPLKVGSKSSCQKTIESRADKSTELSISNSPRKVEHHTTSREERPSIVSPKSLHSSQAISKFSEHISSKTHVKAPKLDPIKKTQVVSAEPRIQNTQNTKVQTTSKKSEPSYSTEKLKVTPKLSMQKDINTDARHGVYVKSLPERNIGNGVLNNDRGEALKENKVAAPLLADVSASIKDLIAAAQAKKNQVHPQNLTHEHTHSGSFSTLPVPYGGIANPVSAFHSITSGVSNQNDSKGFHTSALVGSPSSHQRLQSFADQGELEEYKCKITPGHKPTGGSLSGGTEAAVARDALEGMIETLSRTKESIGRATRQAIDCAKYGIANEVIELLVRKLETEPNFHRRVDLFFLVDSITQCSHNQKGIAGASYLPTVQAALPRLLGAAAPSGSGSRENRRQCLKVLRLWLERKILPESLLRQHMNNIEVPNDNANSYLFLKRPSQAERSIDDPLREMEGMFVNEYGSNASFQLPAFLSANVFEDEEDLSSKDYGNNVFVEDDAGVEDGTGVENGDNCTIDPGDRRHCILEDVDGELEMEDVSTSRRDETMLESYPTKRESQHQHSGESELTCTTAISSPPVAPLPTDSPMPAPLPTSPPPLSPPLPSSPPPIPPPLPHFPLPRVLPPLPSGPYHPSIVQEAAIGNHLVQINGNMVIHGQGTTEIKDMTFLQSSNFLTSGTCSTQSMASFNSSKPFEYGHSDMYTPLSSLPNNQYHHCTSSVQQRQYNPPPQQAPSNNPNITSNNSLMPLQNSTNQFSYMKPVAQQIVQQPFSLCTAPPRLNGHAHRQYNTEDQQGAHHSDSTFDNQHTAWIAGGRSASCLTAPFVQGGLIRPNAERPPSNQTNFQNPFPNTISSGASVPDHGHQQIMPSRHYVSSLNYWRPA